MLWNSDANDDILEDAKVFIAQLSSEEEVINEPLEYPVDED